MSIIFHEVQREIQCKIMSVLILWKVERIIEITFQKSGQWYMYVYQ